MIDLQMLKAIDNQVNGVKGRDQSSLARFRGLSMVVVMGDFYRFSSVTGRALWDEEDEEDRTS